MRAPVLSVLIGAACALLPPPTVLAAKAPAPPRPFPVPPTLPLIRLEVVRDRLLVIEDVLLRRGDWTTGDLDAYVAFGAPGVPRALDAHLVASSDEGVPNLAAVDELVSVERASRRPPRARLLLGSATMAGAILHLPAALFDRATRPTGVARLRIRTLLDAPRPDVHTGREVVVRLGSHVGEPDALGEVEIAMDDRPEKLTRVLVHLCGPDADPHPLSVRAPLPSPLPRDLIAPSMSVRHTSDDLCVRYWTSADADH